MTVLLDGNVLVALTVQEHVHHDAVVDWFAGDAREFATTPTTQGTRRTGWPASLRRSRARR